MALNNAHTPAHRRPLAGRDEAVLLVNTLIASLGELGSVLDEETAHLRLGDLRRAAALGDRKNDATRRYMHTLQAANVNAEILKSLAGDRVELYRASQEAFNVRLQHNLTVLATVQALSDSLVQEIAAAVARSDRPTGYSAHGIATDTRSPNTTRPITLSLGI